MNPNSPLGQIALVEMEQLKMLLEEENIKEVDPTLTPESVKGLFFAWARKNYSLKWGGIAGAFHEFAQDLRRLGVRGIEGMPKRDSDLSRMREKIISNEEKQE